MKKKLKNTLLQQVTVHTRRTLSVGLGLMDSLIYQKSPRVFILCYHSFSNDSWLHSVSLKNLDRQLGFLKENYKIITLSDAEKIMQGTKKNKENAVVITIDDGYEDVLDALPIFEKYNIKPALFVLGDREKPNRKELGNQKPFLKSKDIVLLKKRNWIIGSHSLTHSNLSLITEGEIEKEISESKVKLENEISEKIKYFSYPRGKYNDFCLKTVKKAGYTLGLSMDDGIIDSQTNTYAVPRIGVNNSHSFAEFRYLSSPSLVFFRKYMKKTNIGRLFE